MVVVVGEVCQEVAGWLSCYGGVVMWWIRESFCLVERAGLRCVLSVVDPRTDVVVFEVFDRFRGGARRRERELDGASDVHGDVRCEICLAVGTSIVLASESDVHVVRQAPEER